MTSPYERNDKDLESWIQRLASVIPDEKRKDFFLFGSAALRLQGVDIGRNAGDLDVLASIEAYELCKRFMQIQTKTGADGTVFSFLSLGEEIEVLDHLPGVEFEIVQANARPLASSQGFLVGSLQDLRAWKMKQGRAKDLQDCQAIEKCLKKQMGLK